jgi:hypothetical protein
LQRVFEMYRDLGFTVLAINVEPEQRRLVAPVMTALGVGFVSLQGDWKWAEQNYGVKGTPDAALVDQQGRIMFKPHVHDAETRGVLAREVEALLNRRR